MSLHHKSSHDSSSPEDFDLSVFMSKISDTPLGTGTFFKSEATPATPEFSTTRLRQSLRSRDLRQSDFQYTTSPWRLLQYDAILFFYKSPYLRWFLWSPLPTCPSNELYLWKWSNIVSLSRQLVLLLSTLPLIGLLCMPIINVFATVGLVGLVGFAVAANTWTVKKQATKYQSQGGADFPDEVWLYVNGICCDQSWLRIHCEMLARMFGRRIIGVYNPTFGPVLDMVGCIYQRCFTYSTKSLRQLYETTRKALLRPEISKVVLIAHSQGGIIASQVVDRLIATEDKQTVGKLEVYTFGSAANHFNGDESVRHIEHFANEGDFVAQTGVLAYKTLDGNRYDGILYTNNATGHLLNTHYLQSTFTNGNGAMRSRLAAYLDEHV